MWGVILGGYIMLRQLLIMIMCISAAVCAVCFITSKIVMFVKKKKAVEFEDIKRPWYVTTLRVIGIIGAVIFVIALAIFLYSFRKPMI